jgi:hypothetical protein
MGRIIAEGAAEGEFHLTGDPQVTVWLLSGVVRSAVERVVYGQRNPEELIPIVQELITGALRPRDVFATKPTTGSGASHRSVAFPKP